MANLGSDDTPIVGESFGLPSGWSLTENADGEVVIEDSGGNVVFRRDETAGEWVTDSIDAESVDVIERLGIPVYADDANAPNETSYYNTTDEETKYKDANGTVRAAEQRTDAEIESIARRYSEGFAPEFGG